MSDLDAPADGRLVFAEEVDWVDLDDLEPHPENPRRSDVGIVAASIEANGLYRPVYAQRSRRRIVAGHHVAEALRRLGQDRAPVIWLDVDDDAARRIMLADNRSSDLGSYDPQALSALLSELATSDRGLDGTLYGGEDLEALLAELAGRDAPEEFRSFDDDDVETTHACPKCGYRWSESP